MEKQSKLSHLSQLLEQFSLAAENGQLEEMKSVYEKATPEERQTMLQADRYEAFRWASQRGHVAIVEFLLRKAKELQTQESQVLSIMLQVGRYEAFRWASQRGHVKVCESIWEQAEIMPIENQLSMFNAAIKETPISNRFNMVEHLWRHSSNEQKLRIESNLVQDNEEIYSDDIVKWIKRQWRLERFSLAAENGQLEEMKSVYWEATPEEQQAIVFSS